MELDKKSRNYKLDINTITLLNRLVSDEKERVTQQGKSPLSITAGDIIGKALKVYDDFLRSQKSP